MTSLLSTQQLDELRQVLRHRYDALRAEIHEDLVKSDDESYIELAGRVHDAQDESVADLLVNVNLSIIDAHLSELRGIEQALQRLEAGDYGVCVDCGQEIAHARLAAAPTTLRCVECQTRFERTHAGYSGSSL